MHLWRCLLEHDVMTEHHAWLLIKQLQVRLVTSKKIEQSMQQCACTRASTV